MENFVVSARKYRPATFKTVVGQLHITSTLKNAIKSNHLAQAFLFCGPRGVGKTTTARILAKTINCLNLTDDIEPCNACDSCTSFNESHSFNIYELDAASNNSVDDIRALVEQVRFAPQLGKFKVYIIDEVHMLSTAAFNAFLKTLEEPPAHAIFILATTERHKIIPTILSRCQIFDFNRMTVDNITGHLEYVAQSEGVTYERDALHVIATKADGAMRDSLSIFDQLVNFTGSNLTYKAVIENLNILDYDYYFKITDFILKGDVANTLLTFADILANGFDGHNFITGLGEHFRNLLVCKTPETIKLLEVGDKAKSQYLQQSASIATPFVMQALRVTNAADLNYKNSKNQRLFIEMSLISLCGIAAPPPEEKKTVVNTAPPAQQQAPVANPVQQNTPPPVTNTVAPPVNTTTLAPPPSQSTAPTAPPQLRRGMPPMQGFSIKQSLDTIQNPPDEIGSTLFGVIDEMPQTPFTAERFTQLWDSYADAMGAEGKYNFRTILQGANPKLNADYTVDIALAGNHLKEEFEAERPALTDYLRKELNNFLINIKVANVGIDTIASTSRRPYTQAEKFNYLMEQNPKLGELIKRFDLDVRI